MPLKRLGKENLPEEKPAVAVIPLTKAQHKANLDKAMRRRKALMEILENVAMAREFIGGMNFVDFLSDTKTKYAVIMCLTVIGKRMRFIPPAERKLISEVPWRSILATIRVASQQEWGVVERLIWETVNEDLPALKQTIEKLLKEQASAF